MKERLKVRGGGRFRRGVCCGGHACDGNDVNRTPSSSHQGGSREGREGGGLGFRAGVKV